MCIVDLNINAYFGESILFARNGLPIHLRNMANVDWMSTCWDTVPGTALSTDYRSTVLGTARDVRPIPGIVYPDGGNTRGKQAVR